MKWKELEFCLKTASTLDKQAIAEKEKAHYRTVLECILAIVLFLAERNMVFRGVSNSFYIHGNGNFLGEVQLLAKFNPILAKHQQHIQNAETVAKYYSIILDCTPDISHQEQMTMIIHFLKLQKDKTKIKEYFVGFLKVTDTSGAGLFESLLEKLASLGLDLMDCRGQSYDNGSNMKEKHSGVQARFLQKNLQAFYLPCMNQS
uniref:DUF4371 domain-containing protein n=1 Tax=Octopus bimaculoides TaxID=37653 RepID=A0A0L8H404_OCTBM